MELSIWVHRVFQQLLCIFKMVFWAPERSIGRLFRNGCFSGEKNGRFYLVPTSLADFKQCSIWLHKIFLQSLFNLKDHSCNTWQLSKTQRFGKKPSSHWKRTFWHIFPRIIEYNKHRRTNYKGAQGFLTFFVKMIRSFLWDLRGCQKEKFQKKAVSTMTKNFGPSFLVISCLTNPWEPYIRVNKVVWHLLWKF